MVFITVIANKPGELVSLSSLSSRLQCLFLLHQIFGEYSLLFQQHHITVKKAHLLCVLKNFSKKNIQVLFKKKWLYYEEINNLKKYA